MATTVTFTNGLDVSAFLTDKTDKQIRNILKKLKSFEKKVEADKSATLSIGGDKFKFRPKTDAVISDATFVANGVALNNLQGLSNAELLELASDINDAGTTPTPTPAPTPAPSNLFVLTSGVDTPTLIAGNDATTATLGQLGNGDRIIDASATDSDRIDAELFGNTDSTLVITKVEALTLRALAGTSVVDASNITGVTNLTSAGSGSLTVNNFGSTATVLTLAGTSSNLGVTYTAAATGGSADTVTVNATATTGGNVTLTGAIENVSVKAIGASTLGNVVASNASTLSLSGDAITIGSATARLGDNFTLINSTASKATLFVNGVGSQAILTGAGDDSVDYNANLAASNLVNLGGGSDTLILRGTANAAATLVGVDKVTTKTAATTVALANADSAVALTVEGGGNTVVTGAKAGTTFVSTEAAVGSAAFSFRDAETSTALTLDMREGSSGAYTLTNIGTVTLKASKAITGAAIALDETAGGTVVTTALTVDAAAAGASINAGAAQNITSSSRVTDLTLTATAAAIEFGTFAEAEALKNLALNAVGGAVALGTVGGAGASTALNAVTLNAAGGAVTVGNATIANPVDVATVTVTATGGAVTGNTLTNSLAGFGTLTVTGSKAVSISLTTTATSDRTDRVDASGLTGALTSKITNTGNAGDAGTVVILGNVASGSANVIEVLGRDNSVTGGSGVDTVTGGSGNDTINGGGGNDSLTGAAGRDVIGGGDGDDTLLGGADNDTITAGAGNDSTTGGAGADVIDVGVGTDRIVLTASAESFSGAAIVSGTTVLTGIDVVTGMAGADVIDISGVLNTFTGAAGTTIAAASGTTVALVRGSFNSSTLIFTTDAAGSDTLFVYDVDGAGAGTVLGAIALVGTAGVAGTAAAGVLTLA